MELVSEIETALRENGPLVSSKLITILESKLGKKRNYIQVSLSRNLKKIGHKGMHLSSVTLQHNEHIYFLADQIKTVSELLINDYSFSPVGRLLSILKKERFLLISEAYKLIGQVSIKRTGHKSTEEYLQNIVSDNLVKRLHIGTEKEIIYFSPAVLGNAYSDILDKDIAIRNHLLGFQEAVTSELLDRWRKMNLLSWNYAHQYRRGLENIEQFHIRNCFVDAYGFSYLEGISAIHTSGKKKDPVPVIIESLVYRVITKLDIDAYKSTINLIKIGFKKKVIPVLIYGKAMTKDVFLYAKKSGIALVSISSVFGEQTEEIINSIKKDTMKLKNEIKSIEGYSNTIKGWLLNYAFALLLKEMGYKDVLISEKYQSYETEGHPSIQRECDLVVRDDFNRLLIFELKAYRKSRIKLGETENEKDSVKKFFESTTNVVRQQPQYSELEITPIFISFSGFEDDAIEYMKKRYSDTRLKDTRAFYFPEKVFYDYQGLTKVLTSNKKWTKRKEFLDIFKTINKK